MRSRLAGRFWTVLSAVSLLIAIHCFAGMGRGQNAPVLYSITPNAVPLGWNGSISVSGAGFMPGDLIILDSVQLSTAYVNSYTLTASSIPCCETQRAANVDVAVIRAGGAIQSNLIYFMIGDPPVITSLNPSMAILGSSGFTLTVTGTGFTPGSVVEWGGPPTFALAPLTTTYVSATQLSALIPSSLTLPLTAPTPVNILVENTSDNIRSNNYPISNNLLLNFQPPTPSITNLSPGLAVAGGPGFSLAVNGTNFYQGAVVMWNGVPLAASYNGFNQVTVSIPASQIATPSIATVLVSNPGVGGFAAQSKGVPFSINAPSVSAIAPNATSAGTAGVTITVSGNDFLGNSVVKWGSTALQTTYINSAQLLAVVPANLLATPGIVSVSVANGASAQSNALPFSVNAPTLSVMSPSSAVAGTAGLTLTLSGTDFLSGTQVLWNGATIATTVTNSTLLGASVPATALTSAGTAAVSVRNPGGATSGNLNFSIYGPVATLLTPASAPMGSAGLTLTVNGSNFLAGSSIQWNGTSLATTFGSSSVLTAAVPATFLVAAGTFSLTVVNPGGATSGALNFVVTPTASSLSSVSPASTAAGGPDFVLAVSGTGFLQDAQVLWNSTPLATTWMDASRLSAVVPAALIAAPGAASISVRTSARLSNPVAFTINPVLPYTNTSAIMNAASGTQSIAPGSLISIFGSNLSLQTNVANTMPLPPVLGGTSIAINGLTAPLLYASPTQINAQVPWEIEPGTVPMIIRSGDLGSAPANLTVAANAPGVFTASQSNHAVAVNYSDGKINSDQAPVKPGDYLILYLTGQGAVDNPVATGAAAPCTPLSNALAPVQATIGGQSASVEFAGLAPEMVGVMQLNLLVPDVPPGEQLLNVSIGGAAANVTTVSVGAKQ